MYCKVIVRNFLLKEIKKILDDVFHKTRLLLLAHAVDHPVETVQLISVLCSVKKVFYSKIRVKLAKYFYFHYPYLHFEELILSVIDLGLDPIIPLLSAKIKHYNASLAAKLIFGLSELSEELYLFFLAQESVGLFSGDLHQLATALTAKARVAHLQNNQHELGDNIF